MKILLLSLLLTISITSNGQNLEKQAALADFEEFVQLLKTQSSYYQISAFDFESFFDATRKQIANQDSTPVHWLAWQMEKIIAESFDRHANIRIPDFDEDQYESFELFFPFAIAPLNGKVLALQRGDQRGTFKYYSEEYPYLKSINGKPIDELLNTLTYRRKKSPESARLYDGLKDIRDYGELLFKHGITDPKEVTVVLTNLEGDQQLTLPLSGKRQWWFDIRVIASDKFIKQIEQPIETNENKFLGQWIDEEIAYMKISDMVDFAEYPHCKAYLEGSMEAFKTAKSLIIDIRYNGGGTREILNHLAPYFIPPDQSPWVANVAYVRSDQALDEDISSMQGRYLYNYHSSSLDDDDRAAIDKFNKSFATKYDFEDKKFSTPFYMVLKNGEAHFKGQIYILANEDSFSAASIFTSAFKGLPNVKLVGVTTNGSSGRSKYFHLTHSNIRVKLSSMLSFQRNGFPLDGHGTAPDVVIERNEAQVLGMQDFQLEHLVELIRQEKAK